VLAGGAELDAGAFWEWCERRLPYFAVPRYLEVLAQLPKTPTEKVVKAELRAERADRSVLDRGPTGRAARA
jgi:crotonobetaine/carnitine-CoA ligase